MSVIASGPDSLYLDNHRPRTRADDREYTRVLHVTKEAKALMCLKRASAAQLASRAYTRGLHPVSPSTKCYEPPREARRLFGVSHAAMASSRDFS